MNTNLYFKVLNSFLALIEDSSGNDVPAYNIHYGGLFAFCDMNFRGDKEVADAIALSGNFNTYLIYLLPNYSLAISRVRCTLEDSYTEWKKLVEAREAYCYNSLAFAGSTLGNAYRTIESFSAAMLRGDRTPTKLFVLDESYDTFIRILIRKAEDGNSTSLLERFIRYLEDSNPLLSQVYRGSPEDSYIGLATASGVILLNDGQNGPGKCQIIRGKLTVGTIYKLPRNQYEVEFDDGVYYLVSGDNTKVAKNSIGVL